ncbi:poly(A)-specific ribonuclease PARN isoform X2 [Apium graveolens]
MCQTASLDFLAKYQFDFNTCINEGISYLSRGQEEEAQRLFTSLYDYEFLESHSSSNDMKEKGIFRMADVLFTERMKSKISEWKNELLQVKNGDHESQGSTKESVKQFETIFYMMRPAVKLHGFTSRQLRLIQLVTKNHFKDLAYICVGGEGTSLQQLLVYTDSINDKDLLMTEVKGSLHKDTELKIKNAVGLRHVIDLLSSEKKLIVGHNCFLDLAHLYSKFIAPLPSTGEDYISSIAKYFPHIIDTKLLLNNNDVFQVMKRKRSTSLAKAFAFLCPEIVSGVKNHRSAYKPCIKVQVQVDDTRSSNWNSGAKHEAGYDAFMTGCVFAQACSHLGINFESRISYPSLALEEKLQGCINTLYLSWINGDIIDLKTGIRTLESPDSGDHKYRNSKILFSNIVLLWGFPSKLKAAEIKECILKVFGQSSVTSIYHLDETAVFVLFSKAELVSDFLDLKTSLEKNNDPISVLHPLSKILDGGCTCAANYEVYKEICGSPFSEMLFTDQAAAIGIKWKTKMFVPKPEESHQETLVPEGGQTTGSNSPSPKEFEKLVSVLDGLSSRRIAGNGLEDSLHCFQAHTGS